jgi:hypothetical protein
MLAWLTWDRAGLIGKSGEPSVGKDGESDVESRHLKVCSHYLCRIRTDGLASTSKYWMYWSHVGVMGPVKWCSQTATDAWLCSHCFNDWLGRETGWGPVNRSADGLWIMSGASFSKAVALLNYVGIYTKGCRVWLIMSAYVSCVSDFSNRIYINSNCHDSRIWVIACLWSSARR